MAVRNLFYNIPARRNFLKSNNVEQRHIIDEFQRVALVHHQIRFELFSNDADSFSSWSLAIYGSESFRSLAKTPMKS